MVQMSYKINLIFLLFIFLDTRLGMSQPIQKIVSLAPVITEIILELGQEKALVGKTNHCKVSKNSHAVSVGSYLDTSLEGIVSLNPSLVLLLTEQENMASQLEKLKIKTRIVSNRSINQIDDAILKISQELNVEEKGIELVKVKKEQVTRYLNTCPPATGKERKAAFIFDEGSLSERKLFYISPKGSFYSEVIKLIGLENVTNESKEYSEISFEGLKVLSPEVLYLVTEVDDSTKIVNELSKYLITSKDKIFTLPKEPTLFPGSRYPDIIKEFACANRKFF